MRYDDYLASTGLSPVLHRIRDLRCVSVTGGFAIRSWELRASKLEGVANAGLSVEAYHLMRPVLETVALGFSSPL